LVFILNAKWNGNGDGSEKYCNRIINCIKAPISAGHQSAEYITQCTFTILAGSYVHVLYIIHTSFFLPTAIFFLYFSASSPGFFFLCSTRFCNLYNFLTLSTLLLLFFSNFFFAWRFCFLFSTFLLFFFLFL